jgi:hypothetical protein
VIAAKTTQMLAVEGDAVPAQLPIIDVHVPEPAFDGFDAAEAEEEIKAEGEMLARLGAKIRDYEELIASSLGKVTTVGKVRRAL